jgi:plastocyanin
VPRCTPAVVAALVLAVTTAAGCDDGESNAAAELSTWQSVYGDTYGTGPNDVVVEMRSDGFYPETVRVGAGGRVTWINTGTFHATAENIASPARHFDTHTLYRGQAKSVTFDRPGRFEYFSIYDLETFKGVVVVKP